MTAALELPFDQYQRYGLGAALVEELRGDGPLSVLDVGGRTGLLREFLPEDAVTLVDVEPSPERGLVLGSGARLPFRAGAFDLVAAFDTLEHVPAAQRADFVAECARVARRWVVLVGPYASPRVDEAERCLEAFVREKLGIEHRYLAEHRSLGLPDLGAVERGLRANGARVATFGHGNLERWLALMCLALYLDHDPPLRPVAPRFFRFYNAGLFAGDVAEPTYRHAVVAALGDAPLPRGRLFEAAAATPATGLGELVAELVALDRGRAPWKREIERLNAVVAALERDLEGHSARLADTAADLAAHRDTVAALRREASRARGEHEGETAALRADLEGHRRALEELRGIREGERAGHDETLAAVRADLDGHRRSLDEHRARVAELSAAVDAERGARAESEEGARRLAERLAAAESEMQGLRAELASRWRGLLRALRWRGRAQADVRTARTPGSSPPPPPP